jgi:hypothetical protein
MKPSSQVASEALRSTAPHQRPGRSLPSTRTINPTSTRPADGGKASAAVRRRQEPSPLPPRHPECVGRIVPPQYDDRGPGPSYGEETEQRHWKAGLGRHDQGERGRQCGHRRNSPRRIRKTTRKNAMPVDQRLGDFLNDEHRDHRCRRTCNTPYPVAQNPDEEHKNHAGDECGHRTESDKIVSPARTQIGGEETVTSYVESVWPWAMNKGESSKGRNSQQHEPHSQFDHGSHSSGSRNSDATERRRTACPRIETASRDRIEIRPFIHCSVSHERPRRSSPSRNAQPDAILKVRWRS